MNTTAASTQSDLASLTAGTLTIMLSDVHYNTEVTLKSTYGVNEYNSAIARERIRHVIAESVKWAQLQAPQSLFERCIVASPGDLLDSGIVEKVTANSAPLALAELADVLLNELLELANIFPVVDFVAVPGNHGRKTKGGTLEEAIDKNYDTDLFRTLKRKADSLQGPYKGRVRIHFSETKAEQLWFVYGVPFLMVHGEELEPKRRSAQAPASKEKGLVGYAQVFRQQKKEQLKCYPEIKQQLPNVNLDELVLLFGHFHQACNGLDAGRFIAAGSIKGFDTYAQQCQYVPEMPSGVAWITTPTHGITLSAKIWAYAPSALDEQAVKALPAAGFID